MSAKMATPGLLKITILWNKGYDIIVSVDDVTNKILSRNSNYILDVFMCAKFGNCNISMREVIITSILWGLFPTFADVTGEELVERGGGRGGFFCP